MAKPKYQQAQATISDLLADAHSIAEELRDELQDWYDNLPESFQGGSKGDEIQTAIDQLEEGIYALEEAEGVDEWVLGTRITYQIPMYPKSTYMSRAKRLEIGTAGLNDMPLEMPEDALEGVEGEDERQALEEAWETFCDAISEATSALECVEFPGR